MTKNILQMKKNRKDLKNEIRDIKKNIKKIKRYRTDRIRIRQKKNNSILRIRG